MNHHPHPSTLKQLRALAPNRVLNWNEARSVASRQANRLRRLHDAHVEHRFDTDLIALQPKIQIAADDQISAAGSTHWTGSHWQILLNADDHRLRRRFTIAHEYKHIIDHGRDIDPELEEAICDHFAACLLMPKQLVIAAWTGPHIPQNVEAMALAFDVSPAAMRYRVHDLGLLERNRPRCNANRRRTRQAGPNKIHYRQPIAELLGSPQ